MHFDWMENQQGDERVKAAQRAARDYEKALAIDPDNLDVRTDLGVAYLNDPSSPMLAIQNTNMVLEADSNHVQANFNKGVMLAQIGRTQEAIHHFQKVVRLSKEGDPAHDRALELLGQLGAPGAASKGGPSG
jgi:tetratricopeptide (TPR) repeat protein